jgi:hypothetical protein
VTDAVNNSGLFSSVTDSGPNYRLQVTLVKVMQPNVGFTLTVTVVTHWQLSRTSDSSIVFDDFIATPFSATVGDAFAAIKRLRLANEGAARANIAEGIRRISALSLKP